MECEQRWFKEINAWEAKPDRCDYPKPRLASIIAEAAHKSRCAKPHNVEQFYEDDDEPVFPTGPEPVPIGKIVSEKLMAEVVEVLGSWLAKYGESSLDETVWGRNLIDQTTTLLAKLKAQDTRGGGDADAK